MTEAEAFARDHVAAFNDAVSSGSFWPFLTRFSDDATIRFENVPGAGTLEFAGRAAYTAAYVEQPPDDQIRIAGVVRDDDGTVAIPFAWLRDDARGEMVLTRDGSRIVRMAVLFE